MGTVLSIMVHKQLVCICLGVNRPLTNLRPHVDRQVSGENYSSEIEVSTAQKKDFRHMTDLSKQLKL